MSHASGHTLVSWGLIRSGVQEGSVPTVEIEGTELYYRISGSGQGTVLLLHDYFGTGRNWQAQHATLANYFTVITPDLRGHGRSAPFHGRISVSQLATDIRQMLEHLEVESAHIVGCSLGALIGLTLAQKYPERLRSLLGISIPVASEESTWAWASDYIERIFPAIERQLIEQHPGDSEMYVRKALLANFAEDRDERPVDLRSATDNVEDIQLPVTLVCGEADPVFTPKIAANLHARINGAHLAVIPHAGHFPHRDSPHYVNLILLDHLLGVVAKPSPER
jgi:pimeloyl-ACP methyl ester carboxylesterase